MNASSTPPPPSSSPSPRTPLRPGYDAALELIQLPEGAYARLLLKLTFAICGERLEVTAPEPLAHPIVPEGAPPQLLAGSDHWPEKHATDCVVQGSAYAPDGGAVRSMTVSFAVGGATKKIAVFGERAVRWTAGGAPQIEQPERFAEMPLCYERAYGGLDWRVPAEAPDALSALRLRHDHPGMYPRNPFGRGYLVAPGEVADMLMPNLEDPDDRLSAERLVVGDPRQWHRQPLPWCFDWRHPASFPRQRLFAPGVDAWFPAPDAGELSEVRRGLRPSGLPSELELPLREAWPQPGFFQGASYGLTLAQVPGAAVVLSGMHPERPAVRFTVPEQAPGIELVVDGHHERPRAQLYSLVCRPAEERMTLLYAARVRLPRPLLPGIHKVIPISARVGDDAPITYEAPPTMHEQLQAAKARAALLHGQ